MTEMICALVGALLGGGLGGAWVLRRELKWNKFCYNSAVTCGWVDPLRVDAREPNIFSACKQAYEKGATRHRRDSK
jgi:hypothetical protein